MWVTILNYMTGEVICEEYDDSVGDIETYVHKKSEGIRDVHYMGTESLEMSISELESPTIKKITKQ